MEVEDRDLTNPEKDSKEGSNLDMTLSCSEVCFESEAKLEEEKYLGEKSV